MKQNTTRSVIALALVVLAIAGIAGVGAAAEINNQTVFVDGSEDQTVEVEVSFSGSTTATLSLMSEGTSVASDSYTGSSGETYNLTVDTTGLQKGHYTLVTDGGESTSNVSFVESRMITTRTDVVELDGNANETVQIDVGYNSSEVVNSTISVTESGSEIYSTTQTFDPVEFADGTGVKTSEFTDNSTSGNITVMVTTIEAGGFEGTWSAKGSSASGGLFGALSGSDNNRLLMAGLTIVAALYVLREGYL